MMIHIQEHLDKSKINFDYLVFHDRHEPMEDKVLSLGSKKYVASADNVKFRPFRRIWRINEIRKVCKRNHIKILHYNADCAADMTNIIGAKLGGVQYITIHSHNAGFGAAGNGIRFMSKILKPLIPLFCDNFYGCSELAARFLFPRSIIESGRYSVLPNGIDLEKYDYDEAVRREIRKKLNLEGLVDDDKGFTSLIVQSSKGERILDRIADRYELYATNLEKAIELDGTMICHSAEPHPRRDEYYLNLDKETLRAHIQKFVPIRIRDYLIEKSKGIFYRMGVYKFLKNKK